MFMNNGLRRAATSLLLIVMIALVTRSAFAWYQERQFNPQVLSVVPFQTETGHIAYSIASGKGFTSPFQRDTGPTAWLAPVYPYLLAGIFRLFGIYTIHSFFAALVLNILFSAGTCVPIFYGGRRIAGLGVASAVAWLWALFPNAIIIPFEWIWDTSLSALLVATLLWATLELAESRRVRDWCFYGLLWGFALLINPSIALSFPVLLAWAAYRNRTRELSSAWASAWIVRPALAAAMTILCCVPWTIRNYVQFHRFIPLRSNFAFELYIGNNENYDEQQRFRPGAITQDPEDEVSRGSGQAEVVNRQIERRPSRGQEIHQLRRDLLHRREDLLGAGTCLLYTSDAADDRLCVDLGCRRIIKKKKQAI